MLPSDFIKQNCLAILSPNCLHLIDKLYGDKRIGIISQIAYILASIKHETAHTYAPIAEYGHGEGKPYGVFDPTNQQIYYGRGYIQLTWKENYEKFGQLLAVDLINNPDLALDPTIAYEILIRGMIEGLFTGKKLNDYINNNNEKDYINARKIINGLDQAEQIAIDAQEFEDVLNKVPR